MGLALIMTIPLLRYLQLTTRSFWINQGLIVAMILCALAAVGSQSRGALVGIVVHGRLPLAEEPQQDRHGAARCRRGLSRREHHAGSSGSTG